MRRAQDVLREATGLDHIALTWCWQDHRDWSVLWRQGLGPRTVTDRLVVTPSWCEAEAPEGAVVVTIDPGMAFGTAEHETTRGALRLMDRALSPGERLLDAGCGSAILAISAARLGARITSWRWIWIRMRVKPPGRMRPSMESPTPFGIEDADVTPDWLQWAGTLRRHFGQHSYGGLWCRSWRASRVR